MDRATPVPRPTGWWTIARTSRTTPGRKKSPPALSSDALNMNSVSCSRCIRLDHRPLQTFDLFFDPRGDAIFGQVNLPGANPERARHVLHRPLLEHITIKELKLLRIDLAPDALQGRVENVMLPFVLPDRVDVGGGRIRDAREKVGAGLAGVGGSGPGRVAILSAQLIGD